MSQLETLEYGSDAEVILKVIDRDGACILSNAQDESKLEKVLSQLSPYMAQTSFGNDGFVGQKTKRTGALIARCPSIRTLVMNEEILNLGKTFLEPFTSKLLLHLTQTINIHPGQGAQPLHRDRLAWGTYLPPTIEPQFSTIWALTDFNKENGATRVVPGSHRWDYKRHAEEHEICQAEMKQGSVLLYTGSVIHSGGENKSDAERVGLNLTYCLGWLRQEENQYLSCPPEVARNLDPALQELLGYTQGDYALGYYSDPTPTEGSDLGILPPEHLFGRKASGLTIT